MAASDDIEQAFSKAVALHQRGELAPAESLYRQILVNVPHHLDALNLLGLVAIQTGRNELAVELIGTAIRLNDKVADFHNNIGEAFRRLGDLDRAAGHFTSNAAMTNLTNWHLCERENPSTFGGMYQFWIQKRQ